MANSKKKTYETKAVLLHNGETYATGRQIELTELQAERLFDLGVIADTEQPSVVEVKHEEVQDAQPDAPKEEKPKEKKNK